MVEKILYNDKLNLNLNLDNGSIHFWGHIHVLKMDYNSVDNFIAELNAGKVLSGDLWRKMSVWCASFSMRHNPVAPLITSLLCPISNAPRTADLGSFQISTRLF